MEPRYSGFKALAALARQIVLARNKEDAHCRARYTEKIAQAVISFDAEVEKDEAIKLALEAAGRVLKPLDSRGAQALLRFSQHELERTRRDLNKLALQAWEATEQWQAQIERVRSSLSAVGMLAQRGQSSGLQLLDVDVEVAED